MDENHLSNAVRIIRESKGISQEAIAFKMGITQQAYSKLENKILSARLEQILLIGKLLSIPLITCIHQETHYLNDWFSKILVKQNSTLGKKKSTSK
jgi:transcriptional regulator with XRE-family HTH domain